MNICFYKRPEILDELKSKMESLEIDLRNLNMVSNLVDVMGAQKELQNKIDALKTQYKEEYEKAQTETQDIDKFKWNMLFQQVFHVQQDMENRSLWINQIDYIKTGFSFVFSLKEDYHALSKYHTVVAVEEKDMRHFINMFLEGHHNALYGNFYSLLRNKVEDILEKNFGRKD